MWIMWSFIWSHDLVYKDRLTMPKYIVSALGDEFFLPDDSNYFLSDLQGVTYIRSEPQ